MVHGLHELVLPDQETDAVPVLIADLTATGVTLRENRLKTLEGGTILSSQSCLIANPSSLARSKEGLRLARQLMELMEAHLQAEPYYRLTANVRGASAREVSATVLARPQVAGLRGPTVARVYNVQEEDWYSVSMLVRKDDLMEAVDHIRECGGIDIVASPVSYLFKGQSPAYRQLLESAGAKSGAKT